MKVTKNREHIEISFAYEPRLIALVKTLSGRRYHPGRKSWFVPLAGGMETVEKLRQAGFEIDSELRDTLVADHQMELEAEALATLPDTQFETPLPLFPYQRVGAAFLYRVGSGLLGDDMGLGKTIQSLAVAEKCGARKVLIFTPASVKWQWRDEIIKFIPSDHRTVVVHGSPKKRAELWNDDNQRFYIANYEQLLKDFECMNQREWDLIIADEATKISNTTAKQSKLIKKLRAKRRIAMTGTPISNRANEVWNIIDFTNPGALGGYWQFVERYCMKNQWGGIYGYTNLQELQQRIKRYMIRRLKVDVLPELPEKIITDVPFPLSETEHKIYTNIKKEILFEIEKTDIDKLKNPMTIQYTLVKMIRLRQIADSLELIGQNEKSSKLEVLRELLQENVQNGVKAIIFTQFAEMADILERELAEYAPLKISGKVSGQYSEIVKQFNEEEKHQVLIMTSAGQFGLNIQRASVIVHYDQEWSLAKMQQRDGRAHRIGQTRGVQVFNLLAEKTIDYYIKKILHGKAAVSDAVLGDTPIIMDDIRNMLQYD